MKKWSLIILLPALLSFSCASMKNEKTVKGAGVGGASGAVLGGVIGSRSGHTKEGAILGGAVGAAVGGYLGKRLDQQAKELAEVTETVRTEDGIVTRLKGDILFDTNEAEIKPEAKENLEKLAEIMRKYPENILTIKGFTDSTGPMDFNQLLSRERAESVKDVLVASGLKEIPVNTVGMGPAQPVATNRTQEGRQQNRRVEIEINVDPSKIPEK